VGEITVSEVEINGEKLILESYVSTVDGTTVNYYFQDDVLVRRDNIFADGHVDSTYFAVITTDVPDSYFEIPKGYGYINLSLLEGLM
jgi:CTP:phosphocholine cytidylyltransferase-like protein